MTPPLVHRALRPWTLRAAVGTALAVTGLLATLGSLAVGFGVATACTNTFSCTVTTCAPCATSTGWLTGGWIAQGAYLLTAVVLVALAARGRRPHAVRTAALVLTALSLATIVVTTAVASTSW